MFAVGVFFCCWLKNCFTKEEMKSSLSSRFVLSELLAGSPTYLWMGPTQNYAIPIIQIIYLVTARSIYQTTLRYSGDSQTFVAAERKQDCRGLANKIQCLARKIAIAWLLPTNARRDKSSINKNCWKVMKASRLKTGQPRRWLCCGPRPAR